MLSLNNNSSTKRVHRKYKAATNYICSPYNVYSCILKYILLTLNFPSYCMEFPYLIHVGSIYLYMCTQSQHNMHFYRNSRTSAKTSSALCAAIHSHIPHTHALRLLCAPFPRAHLHFNCTWFISSDDRASWLMLFVINIRIYIHLYGEACNQWNAPNRFAQAGASQQPSPADWCLLWWAPPVSVCVWGFSRALSRLQIVRFCEPLCYKRSAKSNGTVTL